MASLQLSGLFRCDGLVSEGAGAATVAKFTTDATEAVVKLGAGGP